ncbi:MAG: hypothetical protein ACXVYV_08585, partial [Gaiellales bacterium]
SVFAAGVVLHWNGRAWRTVPFPLPPGTPDYLVFHAVGAFAHADAIAVGEYVPMTGPTGRPLAEHWNGTRWTIMPMAAVPGCYGSLSAVARVPGTGDRIAVGGCLNEATYRTRPLIEYWHDTSWSRIAAPPTTGTLRDVLAISAHDIWAVGDTAPNVDFPGRPLVVHWNGDSWSVIPTPPLVSGSDLRAITRVPGSGMLWAVGRRYVTGGVVVLTERWDGRSWTVIPTPSPGGYDALNDVAAASPGNVWAVGSTASAVPGWRTLIEHRR